MAEPSPHIPNVDPFPNLLALLERAGEAAASASQAQGQGQNQNVPMPVPPFPAEALQGNFVGLQQMIHHLAPPPVDSVAAEVSVGTSEPLEGPEDSVSAALAAFRALESPGPLPVTQEMLVPEENLVISEAFPAIQPALVVADETEETFAVTVLPRLAEIAPLPTVQPLSELVASKSAAYSPPETEFEAEKDLEKEIPTAIISAAETASEPEPEPEPELAPAAFMGLATRSTDEEDSEVSHSPFLSPDALAQLGVTEPHPLTPSAFSQTEVKEEETAGTPEVVGFGQLGTVLTGAAVAATAATAETEEEKVHQLRPTAAARKSRGYGMVLGGVVLIAISLLLIGLLAWQWSDAVWAMVPKKPEFDWLAAKARFSTFALGGTSLTFAWLAVGAIRRNRWALPLVHSLAWFVVISVILFLAGYMAGYMLISPDLRNRTATSGKLALIQWALLGGMVLPLVLIFLFQGDFLKTVVRRFDRRDRWTDRIPEALLMLWWPCVLGAMVLGGVAFAGGSFPCYGRILTGTEGIAACSISAALLTIAAFLLAKHQKFGWVLALLTFTTICSSGLFTFLKTPWNSLLTPLGAAATPVAANLDRLPALCFGFAFMVFFFMLLMSRGVLWADKAASSESTLV